MQISEIKSVIQIDEQLVPPGQEEQQDVPHAVE